MKKYPLLSDHLLKKTNSLKIGKDLNIMFSPDQPFMVYGEFVYLSGLSVLYCRYSTQNYPFKKRAKYSLGLNINDVSVGSHTFDI